jgi:hypothetical protein
MDFRYKGSIYPNITATEEVKDVKSGTAASIASGDMVRVDDGNPGYVKLGANGDTSTLTPRAFLAISASDETAGADGTVKVISCPGMVLEGTATTAANLLQAVIDTRVTLDVAGGVQTIDENDTTTGFMRILRPAGGAANFDTTNGRGVEVVVNEALN